MNGLTNIIINDTLLINLPKDIKFHILSFLTNRKNFNQIDKELTETYDSVKDYTYSILTIKTIQELEFLITVIKIMNY
jgi:hypothetical protein